MADHSALIEQLEAWADELAKVQGAPGAVKRVIAGMREVAADLSAADRYEADDDDDDDDDGCPKGDPDCTSRNDECHDACESPALVNCPTCGPVLAPNLAAHRGLTGCRGGR